MYIYGDSFLGKVMEFQGTDWIIIDRSVTGLVTSKQGDIHESYVNHIGKDVSLQ